METLINIDKDIIVLTTKTVEFLLSGNPDSLTLYVFYMKNARIQETNSIWNTNTFGMKGLGWGTKRYGDAKKFLVDNGFIEEVIKRDKKGQIEGRYLQINYIFGREKVDDIIHHYQNPEMDTPTDGFGETNALSNKSINALSNKSEIGQKTLPIDRGKLPQQRLNTIYDDLYFNRYNFYPSNANIASRLKVFKDLLKTYSELQVAWFLICYFGWEKDVKWFEQKQYDIFTFKFNIDKFINFTLNESGYADEYKDSDKLLPIIGKYIIDLKNK